MILLSGRVGLPLALLCAGSVAVALEHGLQSQTPEAQRFTFVGTVDMVKGEIRRGPSLIPIERDAHFVVHVRIDRVLLGEPPWAVGTAVDFLIHSPSRTFGRDSVKNGKFRFTLEENPSVVHQRGCKYCLVALERDATGNE